MTYDSIEHWIRTELGQLDTAGDMVYTADWLFTNDYRETKDRDIRTAELISEVDDQLEHNTRQVLENLTDEGITTITRQGGNQFIRHYRSDRIFWTPSNPKFRPYLREEVARFLIDVDQQEGSPPTSPGETTADGGYRTPRAVAEEALGVPQGHLEIELTGVLEPYSAQRVDSREDIEFDDAVDRMFVFEKAVEAIIESDETSRGKEYDHVGWQNTANRYALSQEAVRVETNHSLGDFS